MPETSLSLLERVASRGDGEAWNRLVDVYTPVLHGWLRRYEVLAPADVDDLVQDVLLAVSKEMPHFQANGQPGAFRGWLRAILVNRLRHFWRSRQHRPQAVGGSDFVKQLEQLSDGQSQITQFWEQEHDRHVMQRLLALAEPRFAPITWQAFRLQALEGISAEETASQLHIPLHSVYAAKSRALKMLREMADGLIP